jgi:hypothetical protein
LAGRNTVMGRTISHIAVVVRNYDEAIAVYTEVIGFVWDLVERLKA